MGNGGNHPLAAGTAPPQARHFGIDTCFVKEHDPADPLGMGREPGLTLAPPYAPDFNLIKLAFSKFKAHMKRLKPRTIDDLWKAAGNTSAASSITSTAGTSWLLTAMRQNKSDIRS